MKVAWREMPLLTLPRREGFKRVREKGKPPNPLKGG